MCWAYRLDLHRAIPIARRGDGPMVGAETDRIGAISERLTGQLAHIELAACTHLRRRRVADV